MEFSKQNLLDYLSGPLNVDIGGLDENSLLFSSGLVDSFSMIDLITYLESTVSIRIEPADITLDNFDTLGRILEFLSSRIT